MQDVLRCDRADDTTTLSKDRKVHMKVMAVRFRAEKERRVDAAVDGERVGLQDDLTFCFLDKNKKKINCGWGNYNKCEASVQGGAETYTIRSV